ncbi:hypothetical protein VM1G_11950 [Cytospora mali]|uniref:Uncharacterized protein n=1 Tax=Cytospora mali TaxID=578113 RepID=A0A194WD36_CYTMA|nr:hypothetical protein VM1G_11950 [Valsa mali]
MSNLNGGRDLDNLLLNVDVGSLLAIKFNDWLSFYLYLDASLSLQEFEVTASHLRASIAPGIAPGRTYPEKLEPLVSTGEVLADLLGLSLSTLPVSVTTSFQVYPITPLGARIPGWTCL